MSIRPEERAGVESADCSGQTVLITGSTDGIGREAALAVGRLGAHVLVHGRSRRKADRVVERIESTAGSAHAYTADFASLDRVRELAEAVRTDVDAIDVLANNAGTSYPEGRDPSGGVEPTLGVNHLAPFLLTHRLLPSIPDDGRIVTTASSAHRGGELDFESLEGSDESDRFSAYARSKLANVLFTRELARRLERRTANCFHPGFIPGSALWRKAPIYVRAFTVALSFLPGALARQVVDTPSTGAATLVYLAVSGAVEDVTGRYYVDCEQREPSPTARDDDLARRLWEWSEEAAGLEPGELE